MIDTHQLNIFLAAAEALSFSEAARRLNMSQPSISQHIQSLERRFGRDLFIRSGRQVSLSDAGHVLLPMARDLVNRAQYIDETMQSLNGEISGHIHVGCSTTPGKYLLPSLLARFHAQHPRVKVSCHVAPQERTLEMLAKDEIHFMMASAPHLRYHDVDLWPYLTDEIVLIAPPDHNWAQNGPIEPDDLLDGVYIMREASSGTMSAVNVALKPHGIAAGDLETLMVLGNPEGIALAVQEGLGVGFVSSLVVARLVPDSVAIVRVRGLSITREVYFGRRAARPCGAAQAAFWDFARGEAAAEDHKLATAGPLLVGVR